MTFLPGGMRRSRRVGERMGSAKARTLLHLVEPHPRPASVLTGARIVVTSVVPVLLMWRHGQRPDFCFAGIAGDLAEAVERLVHYCSDEAPVILGDQHLASAGYAKPAQDFRATGVAESSPPARYAATRSS